MKLDKRSMRLAMIMLLGALILGGLITITILGMGREGSVLQTTITALSTLVGGIIGAFAMAARYYFDDDDDDDERNT